MANVFAMMLFPVLLVVVGDKGEVDAQEQAEDKSLHHAGQELDWQQECAEWDADGEVADVDEVGAELVDRFGGLVSSIDVSKESQGKRQILHQLGNDFDDEDQNRDQDVGRSEFRSREVAEVTEEPVCLDSFVLDVADCDECHREVKAEVRGGRCWHEERQDVADEDDQPESDEDGDVFASGRAHRRDRHVLQEEIKLLESLGEPVVKNPFFETSLCHLE